MFCRMLLLVLMKVVWILSLKWLLGWIFELNMVMWLLVSVSWCIF